MLIATRNELFRMTPGTAGPPVRCFRTSGIVAVAEGSSADVIATDTGDVTVLERDGSSRRLGVVPEPVACLLILADSPVAVLVGTDEGARLYTVTEQGTRPVAAFDALDCRSAWHTPWGGPPAVRSLADTPDGWVYADIHVDASLRTR